MHSQNRTWSWPPLKDVVTSSCERHVTGRWRRHKHISSPLKQSDSKLNKKKKRKRMQLKYNLEKKREEGKQMRTKQKKRKNSNLTWYHVNTLMITGPARGSEFILKRNPLMVCVHVHYICYQPAKLCKTLLLHANTVFHPLEKLPVSVNHPLLSLSLSLSFFLHQHRKKDSLPHKKKFPGSSSCRITRSHSSTERLRFAQFG